MNGFETLLFEKVEAVARISLNRPEVLNAYNIQMRDDFSQALAAAGEDPDIRALLVTGEGRAFCSGADLTEFGTAPSLVMARQVRWERDVWGQFIGLMVPVVVATHGYCIGSGVEIALLGDVRLAAQATVFGLPEVQLGMIPAAGGTQTLPRNGKLGPSMEMLLTGRRFDSLVALKTGLITRVVSEEELLPEAWEIAHRLASLDAGLAPAVKTSLARGADLPLEEALELETRMAAQVLC